MPGLVDKVCVTEVAKEVFENVIGYEKVISNKVNQNSRVMNHIKSIPCYEEVLLLTERHLMGDTGPLSIYLRNNIAKIVRIDLIVKEI